jgi:hypothetical protein
VGEAEAAEDGERERVGEGERGVEAGERGGGGEEEREDGVDRRDASVEGDEGGEGGRGGGEDAGDEEVRVERQEEAPGRRVRVGDDGAERDAQGRHFSGRRRWRGRGLMAPDGERLQSSAPSAPSEWFAPSAITNAVRMTRFRAGPIRHPGDSRPGPSRGRGPAHVIILCFFFETLT